MTLSYRVNLKLRLTNKYVVISSANMGLMFKWDRGGDLRTTSNFDFLGLKSSLVIELVALAIEFQNQVAMLGNTKNC